MALGRVQYLDGVVLILQRREGPEYFIYTNMSPANHNAWLHLDLVKISNNTESFGPTVNESSNNKIASSDNLFHNKMRLKHI